MSRVEKVLSHLNRSGKGLEIGPSHRPMAPKSKGFNVDVMDVAGQEALRAKLQDKAHINVANIEPVDYVWKGEHYVDITGKPKHYDWVIASHVIEHAPDLIGFINDCDAILNDNGYLSLVVPDKRFCFDHFRPVSGLGKVIDSHLNKNTMHTPGTVAEYYLNVVAKNKLIAWGQDHRGDYNLVHGLGKAVNSMKQAGDHSAYLDVHCWCFVPSAFRLIIDDLNALGLVKMKEVGFFNTEGCEFYITLGRTGQGSGIPRLDLLKSIATESCDGEAAIQSS
ncbi:MAG: methyltransferase domain-containing protein [Methylococcales bacterium]